MPHIAALAAGIMAVSTAAQAQSLIDQWNFNETSGTTAANTVGGGGSATLVGSASFNGSGGVTLNGTSGTYISLGSGLLNGLTSVTFEGWWSDTGVNNTHLFSFDSGVGTGGTYLRYNVGDTGNGHSGNSFVENTGTSIHVMEGTPLANDTLLHVAVVYDPSTSFEAIYINGSLSISYSGTLAPVSDYAASSGALGRSPWWVYGDPYLNGTINQFSIYDGVLSDTQIADHFAAGPAAVPEPSTFALAGIGLAGLLIFRRRR